LIDDEDKSNARACQAPSESPEKTHNTFKLFPKLPLDLRLLVWRYTFPGPRLVSLDYAKGNRIFKIPDDLHATRNIELPPTLHLNRESRYEALRAYYLIRWWRGEIRLILNPTRDSICIEFTSFACSLCQYGWIRELDDLIPSCIRQVEHLNILDAFWFWSSWHELFGSSEAPIENTSSIRSVLFFTGLKTILISFRENDWGTNYDDKKAHMQEFCNNFGLFLDRHKNMFDAGKAPRVMARDWQGTINVFYAEP
jgi:hypothetical protein